MNKINKGNLVWFFVLLLFSLFLIYLLGSGKIYVFINPEMVKYTLFGLFGFVILTVFQFKKIFDTRSENKIKIGYLVFLLPLILGITNKGFNASIADKKNVTVAEKQITGKNEVKHIDAISKEKSKYIKDGMVRLDEKNYYNILKDIGENLDAYVDKKIEIIGFVYKGDSFEKNNFVVARMLMTCCAADAQVIGIMAEESEGINIEKGSWVKVKGVIKSKDYEGLNGKLQQGMAVIKVDRVWIVNKPRSEYIYP